LPSLDLSFVAGKLARPRLDRRRPEQQCGQRREEIDGEREGKLDASINLAGRLGL
jgi:hypothetical protein